MKSSELLEQLLQGNLPKFKVTQYSRVHEKKQSNFIDYDPNDLFHGDDDAVLRSLHNLLRHQVGNNLSYASLNVNENGKWRDLIYAEA